MNHLSIEGMDGIGKSTTCRLLSERLGFLFVEKPLHLLFDNDGGFEEYIRIRDIVNANPNRDFTSLFYGLGSLYLYETYKNENIITDRHLASNYAWSGTDTNEDIYELLLKKLGKPRLTVVLTANEETVIRRLQGRDPHDSDIKKAVKTREICERMIFFCEKFSLPYLVVDTSDMTPDEVANHIIAAWEKCE